MNLLSDIYRSYWHIEPVAAVTLLPVAQAMIEGSEFPADFADAHYQIDQCVTFYTSNAPSRINIVAAEHDEDEEMNVDDVAQEGSTAVVPIIGAITKYRKPSSSTPGTKDLEAVLQQLANSKKVGSIVLQIDSPGGAVYGTNTLVQRINTISKPVIAFVDSQATSAGMEIASAADEIIASTGKDQVGSIGTMISFADMKGYYEQLGVKFHEIYATQSTEKNREMREAEGGFYQLLRERMLDPLNEEFIETVRTNRGDALQNPPDDLFKGRVYFAQDAVSFGLIDSIANFETTMTRAKTLAQNQSESKTYTI